MKATSKDNEVYVKMTLDETVELFELIGQFTRSRDGWGEPSVEVRFRNVLYDIPPVREAVRALWDRDWPKDF